MNNLRNIAIVMLTVTMLFSIAGLAFAYYQFWFVALMLLFGTILVGILTILLSARYMSWNTRTGEQGTKADIQKLSARVNEAISHQQKANEELRDLITSVSEDQRTSAKSDIAEILERMGATSTDVESQVAELGQNSASDAKRTRQHVTSATRESTRQIESLVHLYQRYPDVKLPMPGTGGFAIDSQALAHLIALVEERRPQRILELGSGSSTIWLGYLCRSFGGTVVSLDHLDHYLEKTRTAIARHELEDVVETRLAPLEAVESGGQSYQWYSLASMRDLTDIDMVLIDGPPAATGPQARYPALPHVIDLLTPNATVVLDDAHRREEAQIVESWLTDYPEFREIEQGTSRLAVLERTIPSA